jgi:hypothetical protein
MTSRRQSFWLECKDIYPPKSISSEAPIHDLRDDMDQQQQTPEDILRRAFDLQEVLESEHQQLKLHEEEYKRLLAIITTYETRRVGAYEAIRQVKKRRYIISDLFRKKWPGLFNRFAKVSIKDAKTELRDDAIETVCGVNEVIRWEFVFHED